MLKLLLSCILLWVCVISQTQEQIKDNEELKEKFEQFIVEYNREYKDDNEKAFRFTHFVNNVRKAEELNKIDEDAEFGITKFSDWTEEELKRLLGARPVEILDTEGQVPLHKFNHGQAPAVWDWREHNAVTPVKDQELCGSCWAFSAIGNIEGQFAIKHNKLISFSELEIVDCSKSNHGCFGGNPVMAIRDFVKSGELIETERNYSYKAHNGQCHFNSKKGVAKVIGYNLINAKNEEELKQALYKHGPLSFSMNADGISFFMGDILSSCPDAGKVDHSMLIVGYGTNYAGVDYWIVKNSWGATWNHDGYFKMKRGINICEILDVGQIVTSQVA